MHYQDENRDPAITGSVEAMGESLNLSIEIAFGRPIGFFSAVESFMPHSLALLPPKTLAAQALDT